MALAGTSKISYKHRSCGGWTINSLWNFKAVEVSSGKILRDGEGTAEGADEGADKGADEGVDDDLSFILPCVFRTVLDEAAAAAAAETEEAAAAPSISISIIRVITNSILNIRVSGWNK